MNDDEGKIEGKVTKFGNGGHVIVKKKYIGKKVEVIIK